MAKLTLKARFTYQKPTEDQLPRYEAIRKAGLRFARVLLASTEQSASSIQQEMLIQEIEHAVMYANKIIALEKFKRE